MDWEKEAVFWKNRATEEVHASEDTVRERDDLLEERACIQAAFRSMMAEGMDAYEEFLSAGREIVEKARRP